MKLKKLLFIVPLLFIVLLSSESAYAYKKASNSDAKNAKSVVIDGDEYFIQFCYLTNPEWLITVIEGEDNVIANIKFTPNEYQGDKDYIIGSGYDTRTGKEYSFSGFLGNTSKTFFVLEEKDSGKELEIEFDQEKSPYDIYFCFLAYLDQHYLQEGTVKQLKNCFWNHYPHKKI